MENLDTDLVRVKMVGSKFSEINFRLKKTLQMDRLKSYFGAVCSSSGAEVRDKLCRTKSKLHSLGDNIGVGDEGQPIIGDNTEEVEEFRDSPAKK